MPEENEPTPKDLGQLAKDAGPAANTNSELAADLNRVRGMAVERAKATNDRLLKQAHLATLLGIGAGILLDRFASRRRRRP